MLQGRLHFPSLTSPLTTTKFQMTLFPVQLCVSADTDIAMIVSYPSRDREYAQNDRGHDVNALSQCHLLLRLCACGYTRLGRANI
jgi:hypothetical protein